VLDVPCDHHHDEEAAMPVLAWILMWVVIIGVIAIFAVRQLRTRSTPVPEFDRNQHEAVREASMNLDARGPNGQSQTWL
jgi:hypothetical protein